MFLGTFLAYVKCGQLDSKIWHTFAWIVWHPLMEVDGEIGIGAWKGSKCHFQLGGMAFSIDQK
jgi:hypothetical protein